MTGVEDPTKCFGEVVRGVDNSRDGFEDNVASLAPILNCKVLNVDVARALGRLTSVDHFDRGFIVFIKWSSRLLGETKLTQNRAQVLSNLGGGDGGDEFGFCRAGGRDCLGFRTVGNDATS